MRRLLWLMALVPLMAFTASAEKIELANGDKVDVEIVSETETELVVRHPQLGEFTVPRSALKPPKPPHPGLFGTNFMQGWKREAGLGFGGAQGNTEDANVNARFGFNREAKTFRGRFEAVYFYATQNGVKNTNAFRTNYSHDFLFGDSGLYIFVLGRYQYDEFQSWRNRVSGSGGLGYDFIKHKKGELRGEVGAGVAREFGDNISNFGVTRPEGQLGLLGAWRPLEGHELSGDITYFPDFKNTPQFRLLANIAYRVAIPGVEGLSIKLGINNEYDSSIDESVLVSGSPPVGAPGARFQTKNNLKYFGNLVYAF